MTLRREFLEMARESMAAGSQKNYWGFEEALDNFEPYTKKLLDYGQGRNLPEGWVSASTFWLVKDDETLLGRTSIRHSLTPALDQRGGHIGYYIRPSQRGQGYGTLILALSLEKAKDLGLKRVLVTCDDDNIASARIIQNNGGKLADKTKPEGSELPTRRYWIDLT